MFKQQGGLCYYCDVEMFLSDDVTKEYRQENIMRMASFEHIIPKSKGGTYKDTNAVCACHKCNTMRGNMDFEVFRENVEMMHEAWEQGVRIFRVEAGKVVFKMTKKQKNFARKIRKGKFMKNEIALAKFATLIGVTVEDLFNIFVYNNVNETTVDDYAS